MWTLNGNQADLVADSLRATVPLGRPADGISEIQFAGHPLSPTKLLAISPDQPVDRNLVLVDQYVRGCDLVAVYEEAEPQTLRSQVYWRVAANEPQAAVLELIVSMQTSRLDSDPRLAVTSELAVDEVLHLPNMSAPEFACCQPDFRLAPDTSTGLLLARLADSEASWMQMVHPADFVTAEVKANGASGVFRISHYLFSERLEKGVIRRGRLRGMFVLRTGDTQAALHCYAEFSASVPPLTV